MPRPQFSIRGLLLLTTAVAVVLAAARLVPHNAWPMLVAMHIPTLFVFALPVSLLLLKKRLKDCLFLMAFVLIFIGLSSALIGGAISLLTPVGFNWLWAGR